MAERKYFRRVYKTIGVAATQPFVEDDKAPEGCEIHYQRITVNNDTTDNGDVIIQVNNMGTIIPIGTILNIQSNEPMNYKGAEIVVQNVERLRLQFAASANGDVLTTTLEGYLWNRPKGN